MLSLFVFCWLLVTNIILIVCLITQYFSQHLPKYLSNLVRFGKLIERSVSPTNGFTFDAFIAKYMEIPKKYFTHFYVFSLIYHLIIIGLMFGTNCLTSIDRNHSHHSCNAYMNQVLALILGSKVDINSRHLVSESSVLLMLSLIIQFSRRLYENVRICVFSDSKINAIHYAIGYVFYTSCGLALIDSINTTSSSEDNPIISYALFVLFLTASYFQFKSNLILSELRIKWTKDGQKVVQTYGHFMPMGFPFALISCPHYLAEIVIYGCICGITGFNISWLVLFFWVCVNQTMAAILTHEWYLKTFQHKYPKHRKAIIPYIL